MLKSVWKETNILTCAEYSRVKLKIVSINMCKDNDRNNWKSVCIQSHELKEENWFIDGNTLVYSQD